MPMTQLAQIELQLHADLQSIRTVSTCARALLENHPRSDGLPVDDELQYNVELATQEICTNIVKHSLVAADDVVTASLHRETNHLLLELRNNGKPYDSQSAVPSPTNTPTEDGYGMFLARELLTSVQYERQGDQNIWRLRLTFEPATEGERR